MTLTVPELNLLAVFVTGLATFFLGGFWYVALFGNMRLKYLGIDEEQLKVMAQVRPPHLFYETMLFAYWILATLVGFPVHWARAETWQDGALLGLVLWGLVQCIAITACISGKTRKEVYFIDGAYQFCYLILAGILLTLWK